MPTISIEESNKRFYSSDMNVKLPFITEAMNGSYRNAAANFILDICGGALQSGKEVRILEAGCNAGYFMNGLYDSITRAEEGRYGAVAKRISYTGVDISRYALVEAGKIVEAKGEDFFKTRLLRRDLPKEELGGNYDIVIMNELLDDIGSLLYTRIYGELYEVRPLETIVNGTFSVSQRRFTIEKGLSKERFSALSPYEKELVRNLDEKEVTVVSPNSIRLLGKLVSALHSGGTMLIHDYGWFGGKLNFFEDSVVRAYGQRYKSTGATGLEEIAGRYQMTTDVNFWEIKEFLENLGDVRIFEHKNFIRKWGSKDADNAPNRSSNDYGFFDLVFRKT